MDLQPKIKINGIEIYQPDSGLGYDFETTYTDDSTRSINGKGNFTPLFTVESLSYSAKMIPLEDTSKLLQLVVGKKQFELYYLSPYFGQWRVDKFYIAKGSMSIGSVKMGGEYFESLSFNMIGINKLPEVLT